MNITIPNDSEVTAEALEVLMKHLSPSKVAKLASAWRIGNGDYLKNRDEIFAEESVDSLFIKMQRKAAGNGKNSQ